MQLVKKPRPAKTVGRKRRAAGWMLLALGVLVAAVWVASRWWYISLDGGVWSASAESGWAYAGTSDESPSRPAAGFEVEASSGSDGRGPEWQWFRRADPSPYQSRYLGIGLVASEEWSIPPFKGPTITVKSVGLALWPIPLLLCTPAALLLRSGIIARRRAVTGACPKCGYSLSGLNKVAACPECGAARASPER